MADNEPAPAHALGLAAALDQLRDRDFRRLFLARFVSSVGTGMSPVAMAFGVLYLTGSPTQVGLVIASQTAAHVTFQLFAGALADRWSRQRLMVTADLLAAASQTTIAVLLITGTARVPWLMALMAVNGVAFAFHWPSAGALVPQVVPRHRLQPANALLALSQSSAIGLGGASAGLLVALFGAGWAVAVDALTFLTSAVLVAQLRPAAQIYDAGASLLEDLRAGWREFSSHRWLWATVLQFSLLLMAWNGGFLIVGPIVAERSLGGAATWGLVAGAFGLGNLCGAGIGIRVRASRPMLVGTLSMFSFAFPLLLLSLPAAPWLIAFSALLAGASIQLFAVYWMTAVHTHIPPQALSRVFAYDAMGSIALAPAGEALAGPMVEWLGSSRTLRIAAAMVVVPTLLVLGVPEVRQLRDVASEGTADGRDHGSF